MSAAEQSKFWSLVKKEDCWHWIGSVDHAGDGYMWVNKLERIAPAARLAWQLTIGDIPPKQVVIHTCPTVYCINPHHMKIGSRKQVFEHLKAIKRLKKGKRRNIVYELSTPEQQELKTELNKLFASGDITKRELADKAAISRMTLISFCTWNKPVGKKTFDKLQQFLKDFYHDAPRI